VILQASSAKSGQENLLGEEHSNEKGALFPTAYRVFPLLAPVTQCPKKTFSYVHVLNFGWGIRAILYSRILNSLRMSVS